MRNILRKLFFIIACSAALHMTGTMPAYAGFDGTVKDYWEQPEERNEEEQPAAEQTENSNPQPSTGVTAMDYMKMIFALIFVIALIYFLLKFINQKSKSFQQTKLIHNLGGTTLGGNRSVQLVKVGGRILVLGVGEDIQLLKEIDETEEKEEILNFYEDKSQGLQQQKDILTQWVGKKTGIASDKPKEAESFQSLLKSQIDDVRKGRKKMLKDLDKETDNNE
ncbi:flagellar biosynthesis protein FliZ [Rossellomorea vietnamensis]|uniref:Flagellar biosynthesis protein FliZ n=1 Tax=Rossellomorea vietnamensis TaxID=218284 RepID=A0A5D4MFN0_9BACI|nr:MULTISPECIES: flagellar biosynthetic protein FliO [Bacillaceae]TYS00144.1 flagellar biosynthesis protein FliZ [Rossellomorea vietnamensis]